MLLPMQQKPGKNAEKNGKIKTAKANDIPWLHKSSAIPIQSEHVKGAARI